MPTIHASNGSQLYNKQAREFLMTEDRLKIVNTVNSILVPVYYSTIPICCVTILGNIFILIVFSSKSFKNLSSSFFIRILCFTDMLMMTNLMYYFVLLFDARFWEKYSSIANYFKATIPLFSPWILVLVTFDRFISVASIKWALRNNKRRRNEVVLVACICLILAAINSFKFFDNASTRSITNVYPYVAIAISSVVPFTLMCTFNVVTFIRIRDSKMKFNANTSRSKENRFLMMSISLNVLFLVSDLPRSVTLIWGIDRFSAASFEGDDYFTSLFQTIITSTIETLAVYWKMIQPMSQFFVYYALNPMFRKEFMGIFMPCCSKQNNSSKQLAI